MIVLGDGRTRNGPDMALRRSLLPRRLRARLDAGRPYSDVCFERVAHYSYDAATAGAGA